MPQLPPGPRAPWRGLGLALQMRRDFPGFFLQLGRDYGDLAYWPTPIANLALINRPEWIREVLIAQAKKFRKQRRVPDLLRQIDGEGLAVSEGDFWRRQRRMIQPAFSSARQAEPLCTAAERAAVTIAGWRVGRPLEISAALTELMIDINARALFGGELGERAGEFARSVRDLSEVFTREAAAFASIPDWLPLPDKLRKRRAIRALRGLVDALIAARRSRGELGRDLLGLLLAAVDDEGDGQSMSDMQARDEAMTLFNAGHDSSAAGLAWACHALSRAPAIADAVAEEARAVREFGPFESTDLPRLSYARQVVDETLRLYPPTYMLFARECLEDVVLGDYVLPRRTWAFISPLVTQRDPRYFPEPERFDPDRFSPARSGAIPQHTYFPFGAGPHVCIGMSLALGQMTLVVSTLCRDFRVRPAVAQQAVDWEPLLSLRPRGGLHVVLERR